MLYKETFQYIVKYFFNSNRMNIIFIILLSFVINFMQVNVLSKLTAQIISALKENKIELLFDNYKFFLFISLMYIIVFVVYKYFQNNLIINLRTSIREKLLSMILKTNSKKYSNINFSKYHASINRYLSTLQIIFSNMLSNLLPNITLIFIIFGYFLYKDFIFSLIFLIGISILIIYLNLCFNDIHTKLSSYELSILNDENKSLDILNNNDKIIFRGNVDNYIDDFKNKSSDTIDKGKKYTEYIIQVSFIANIILFITIGLLIFYLINITINKKIDQTFFITFFTILLLFRDRISWCIQQFPDYIEAFFRNVDLINNISHYEYEEIINNKNKIIEGIQFNTIHFKNVSFSYEDNKIFNNHNMNINIDNKIIGITGKSGVGKSTFVKLILKLYDYNGSIYIDDIDIKKIDCEYLRKNIIYINQNSKLFDDSIYNNLLYGSTDKNKSHDYLNEVFQFEKVKNLLHNINIESMAGLNGEKISGGQRQVVNIINGLICDSPVLILDEPTNALNNELKTDVIHMIKHFKKYKKCIIIITHDSDIHKIFDEKIEF